MRIAQHFECLKQTTPSISTAGITSAKRAQAAPQVQNEKENELSLLKHRSLFVLYCHWQCLRSLCRGFQGKDERQRSQFRLKNSLLYTLITWLHLHLISSFHLVEPLIIHFPRGEVATSYAYDFLTTNEAL